LKVKAGPARPYFQHDLLMGRVGTMETPEIDSIEAVRAKVVSLLIECPVEGNLDECPLHEKRSMSFYDKFEWLKSLPDDVLQNIYVSHCNCLKSNIF
jgi:hypothetical protein